MKAARFVVETHAHITTLYKPKGVTKGWKFPEGWTGLGKHVETFDNSPFTLYDMEVYGVDMCILKPSQIGNTNEMQAMLVNKYPNKFRACCSDLKQQLKISQEKCEWSIEVAVEEVESALKWGKDKFVCIGEFVPGCMGHPPRTYTFRQRLDEWRTFMDLGAKYGVALDFHESTRAPWGGGAYAGYGLLSAVVAEYPNVPVIIDHGGGREAEGIQKAVQVAARAGGQNVYLETGCWTAEFFKFALTNPNVGATRLIWGHDYGNTPQYILKFQRPGKKPISYPVLGMHQWSLLPSYQTDFWGWSLHQIHRLKDWNWATQDEVNLILGGNAAKIFKLPVLFERMFPEGRPDLYGVRWEKSVPLLPIDQIKNPDYPES